MSKHIVYLCIGGNLGEREANLEETLEFIEFNFGDVEEVSSVYETEAWEMENEPPFLNQVIRISTELTPEEVMQEIAELEEFYGRERSAGTYLSREMDVDMLFYDDLVMNTGKIIIPHPRLHLRRFVLVPLNEIAPDLVHPQLGKPASALLKDCEDQTVVKKIP